AARSGGNRLLSYADVSDLIGVCLHWHCSSTAVCVSLAAYSVHGQADIDRGHCRCVTSRAQFGEQQRQKRRSRSDVHGHSCTHTANTVRVRLTLPLITALAEPSESSRRPTEAQVADGEQYVIGHSCTHTANTVRVCL